MSMVITKNWTELVRRENLQKPKTLSAVTNLQAGSSPKSNFPPSPDEDDFLQADDTIAADFDIALSYFAFKNGEVIELLKRRGQYIRTDDVGSVRELDARLVAMLKDQENYSKWRRPSSVFITFQSMISAHLARKYLLGAQACKIKDHSAANDGSKKAKTDQESEKVSWSSLSKKLAERRMTVTNFDDDHYH